VPLPSDFDKHLLVPTYRFASGWGIRRVTKREVCSIWGLSSLESTKLDLDCILALNPTQSLSLVINSIFLTNSSPIPSSIKLTDHLPPSTTTLFTDINTEIPNDWVDHSVVLQSNRKEDKAPTPSELWDRRIILSFPQRLGIAQLIQPFRMFLLRVYRRRVLHSLVTYLRSTFTTEWINYLNGD